MKNKFLLILLSLSASIFAGENLDLGYLQTSAEKIKIRRNQIEKIVVTQHNNSIGKLLNFMI